MADSPIFEFASSSLHPFATSPLRILFCRLGGIGDVLHTLPLVKYLRKRYPNSSIEYITSSSVADLLESHCPYINKVWVYNKREQSKIAHKILQYQDERQKTVGKIDYFFNLHNSFSFYFFNLFFIKAKQFFQYKKDKNVHAVINFARTYDKSISAFELESKTLIETDSAHLLKKYNLQENKYICLVPGVGTSRIHRAWPFENWFSLAKKFLFIEKNIKIVFLGGEDERKMFDGWVEKDPVINLIGKLSLPDTAKIISNSLKVISGDTGLLHLASALSKKVVGLYGPTLPKRTGPFTSEYQILVAKNCKCINKIWDIKKCKMTKLPKGFCMDSLTVDNVLTNVSSELVGKQIKSVF